MSASKNTPGRVAAALTGVLGMSAVAGVLVAAMVTPAIAVTSLAANNTIGLFEDLPDYLQIDNLAQKTELYATQGGQPVKFAEFYAQNREEVGWDEVSDNAKAAAVDTEDPRFYEHGGVDVQSTFRALAQNVIGGGVESGASTITMQYVKNVLVQKAETLATTDPDAGKKAYAEATQESTARKLKEMRLAIGLEKKFSKNDILLGYLNIANYGGSVYGIQSAAKYYYGVDAKDLSIAQAASLVATVNYPTALRIDEPGNIKANQARRDILIDNMLKHHSITQQQHDEAIATAVTPAITPSVSGCNAAQPASAAYFCDAVKYTVENSKEFGDTPDEARINLNRNGYKIYTTLNLDLQAKATDDMRKQIPTTTNSIPELGSAMTSVEAKTGRVIAMVQNTDYGNNAGAGVQSVNFNTDQDMGGSRGFQVGSTYKIVTLLELAQGGALGQRGRELLQGDVGRERLPRLVHGRDVELEAADGHERRGCAGCQPDRHVRDRELHQHRVHGHGLRARHVRHRPDREGHRDPPGGQEQAALRAGVRHHRFRWKQHRPAHDGVGVRDGRQQRDHVHADLDRQGRAPRRHRGHASLRELHGDREPGRRAHRRVRARRGHGSDRCRRQHERRHADHI